MQGLRLLKIQVVYYNKVKYFRIQLHYKYDPPLHPYTLLSRLKSRHTNQNLSKSMAAQSHGQPTENKARKHNEQHKTLAFMWLCKYSSTRQVRCNRKGK